MAKRARAELPHITVFDRKDYYPRKGYIVHLCTSDVPEEARRIKDGLPVLSPEMLYLQFAWFMPFHELVVLGHMMCAMPNNDRRMQATTVEKLRAFLDKCKGFYGRKKAMRALRYVREECRSVPEALSQELLSLPYRLGGAGIRDLEFNHKIELDEEKQRRLGRNHLVADLFSPRYGAVFEFDSDYFHGSEEVKAFDRLREKVLRGLPDIKDVVSLTKGLITNQRMFRALWEASARRVGRRIRIRSKVFAERSRQLMRMVRDALNGIRRRPKQNPDKPAPPMRLPSPRQPRVCVTAWKGASATS